MVRDGQIFFISFLEAYSVFRIRASAAAEILAQDFLLVQIEIRISFLHVRKETISSSLLKMKKGKNCTFKQKSPKSNVIYSMNEIHSLISDLRFNNKTLVYQIAKKNKLRNAKISIKGVLLTNIRSNIAIELLILIVIINLILKIMLRMNYTQ